MNGREQQRLVGFHVDGYAWAAMATQVFIEFFVKGIDLLRGIRTQPGKEIPHQRE